MRPYGLRGSGRWSVTSGQWPGLRKSANPGGILNGIRLPITPPLRGSRQAKGEARRRAGGGFDLVPEETAP